MSPNTHKKSKKFNELPQNLYNNLKPSKFIGKLNFLKKSKINETIIQKNKSLYIPIIPFLLLISSSLIYSLTYLNLIKTTLMTYFSLISIILPTLLFLRIIFNGYNTIFTKFYNKKISFYHNFFDYNLCIHINTNING